MTEDAETPSVKGDDVENHHDTEKATHYNRDEEMTALVRRVEQLERLTGLPDKETSLSRVEIVRSWLINTINIKLHLLGNRQVATLIALSVLAANIVFVIVFTKWQVNECVANTSVVESDFSIEANQEFYAKDKIGTWEQEIFLCSSQSLLLPQFWEMNDDDFMQRYTNQDDDVIITDDGFILHTSGHFKSCTLPGFTYTDYDLDNQRCPDTSDFGYDTGVSEYRHGCSFVDDDEVILPNFDDDFGRNGCPNGREEEVCGTFVALHLQLIQHVVLDCSIT